MIAYLIFGFTVAVIAIGINSLKPTDDYEIYR